MKLNLDALLVLDAIERKGSFAAAAASLNRVPSAVSYSVQKLEQDLGATLFRKEGRRAVLTHAGRLLVDEGRQLLVAAEKLALDTQQAATGWEPRLRIARDHSIDDHLLNQALQRLYAERPDIAVSVSEEVLGGTWEALLEDRVDLAVGAVDEVPSRRGLRHEPWFTNPFVFCARADHPICAEPRPLGRETIARYRLVVINDSSRNQPAISRGIAGGGATLVVSGMRQKLQAQLAGLGVGTLPRYLVQPHLDSGEMCMLPLAEALPSAPCHLAWRSANRGRALALVVEQLRSLAPAP
ncbi:MAG: LysR family transcriptional regulator [Halioglobus sp.]|nr:LysR family transcriptional regulator [Halioglobus sp.]